MHTLSTVYVLEIRERKITKAQCVFKICMKRMLQLRQEKPRMCHYSVTRQGPDSLLWVSGLNFITHREHCEGRRKSAFLFTIDTKGPNPYLRTCTGLGKRILSVSISSWIWICIFAIHKLERTVELHSVGLNTEPKCRSTELNNGGVSACKSR